MGVLGEKRKKIGKMFEKPRKTEASGEISLENFIKEEEKLKNEAQKAML